MIAEWIRTIVEFIGAHREWAGPIVFGLAFGESLAFLSLLFPATAALVAAGTLAGAGALDVWTLIVWAIPGAVLGDAFSYWVGRHFRFAIPRVWPFARHPEMLALGYRFFQHYGSLSVFIGRFFGPLRAIVPLVAGMMNMPPWPFQLANVASAMLWAPGLLIPGEVLGIVLARLSKHGDVAVLLAIAGAGALVAAGLWVLRWLKRTGRWPFRPSSNAGS